MSNDTKICITCGEERPLSQYHRSHHHTSGIANQCKTCDSARQTRYRQARRLELGEDEYLARRRAAVRKARTKPEVQDRDRRQRGAWNAALKALRRNHLDEWEVLYKQERAARGLST